MTIRFLYTRIDVAVVKEDWAAVNELPKEKVSGALA